MDRTPKITFGIKHSPLLGQLKPVEPQRNVNDITNIKTNYTNDYNSVERNVTNVQETVDGVRTHVTQVKTQNGIRSNTVTPEPIQEMLNQEIVWVPEQSQRRGSYTIEKVDGNNFTERYGNSEVIPVQNGLIRVSDSGERGAACNEEHSSEIIENEDFVQNVDKRVHNANAHEKSQKATEEVYVDSDVKHLPNGGVAKMTTTTTVKKAGTTARNANSTTAVTRTKTTVTSRDVGTK